MSIKSFADQTTEDVFYGRASKAARRLNEKIQKAARKRLDILAAAQDTRELSALPGNGFESLKHSKPGFYSMRINDQYRLIFRFENGDAFDAYLEGFDHTGRR